MIKRKITKKKRIDITNKKKMGEGLKMRYYTLWNNWISLPQDVGELLLQMEAQYLPKIEEENRWIYAKIELYEINCIEAQKNHN